MNNTSMPTEVWHYTDANGLLGIVQNRSLWAGCTDFMNDEKEAIKGFDLLRSRWGTQGSEKSNERDRAEIDRVIDKMEKSKTRQYIVSASEQSDSLTLWRNYGREAVSYAICLTASTRLVPVPTPQYKEIERWPYAPDDYLEPYLKDIEDPDGTFHQQLIAHPDDVLNRQRPGWNKVEYEVEKQREIVDRIAFEILEKRNKRDGQVGSEISSLLNEMEWESKLTLIKDEGFRHEEEVRLHYYSVAPEWRFVHYRATSLGVTPYIVLTEASDQNKKIDHLWSEAFEQSPQRLPIVGVRIGPTRYPELAERGLRSLLEENGYHGVPVLKSEVPFR